MITDWELIRDAKDKLVTATGCCGTGDGVEVTGILTENSPICIVTVSSGQLYEVIPHTIKAKI